jgi:hypothetical protein
MAETAVAVTTKRPFSHRVSEEAGVLILPLEGIWIAAVDKSDSPKAYWGMRIPDASPDSQDHSRPARTIPNALRSRSKEPGAEQASQPAQSPASSPK